MTFFLSVPTYHIIFAAGENMGSSSKIFSTSVAPNTREVHWAEMEVGKAWMTGSISPTSGPATGTSGKEGRVMGWLLSGKIITMPSGWSWASFS